MIGKLMNNILRRQHARVRADIVRYEMEHAASLMADYVIHDDSKNAQIMALRFQRLGKDYAKLKAESRR